VNLINRLMIVFVVCVLLGGVAVGWQTLNYPVSTLTINGELTPLERATISDLLAAQDVVGVLNVDLEAIQRVLQSLGWAHNVAVRREWPDRLVVAVSKVQPVARRLDGGYLSADGKDLELPDVHGELPVFDIRISTAAQAMEVFRLLDQIVSREGFIIRELHEDGLGEWQLVLGTGLKVSLGSDQLSERMHRLLFAYRSVLRDGERHAEYIDARYHSGVAVRFSDMGILTASIGSSIPLTDDN
jgi:cell division protein FtsQ